MNTPVQRYRPSPAQFPDRFEPIEYPESDIVLKVKGSGWLVFEGQRFRICQTLQGEPVGLRADPHQDGLFHVFYCHHRVTQLDLHAQPRQT